MSSELHHAPALHTAWSLDIARRGLHVPKILSAAALTRRCEMGTVIGIWRSRGRQGLRSRPVGAIMVKDAGLLTVWTAVIRPCSALGHISPGHGTL